MCVPILKRNPNAIFLKQHLGPQNTKTLSVSTLLKYTSFETHSKRNSSQIALRHRSHVPKDGDGGVGVGMYVCANFETQSKCNLSKIIPA